MKKDRRAYQAEYYRQNREKVIQANIDILNRKRVIAREYINTLKSEAACADCGVRYPNRPWRMSFDHLPEFEKDMHLSKMANGSWKLDRIKAEVAKCEIVCLLCHADRSICRARGLSYPLDA